MATLFKRAKKATPAVDDDSAQRGISSARVRELLAEVDAEEAAAATVEHIGQSDTQWAAGRRRITRAEAEAIKRQWLGGSPQRFFTLSQRMAFLEMYEVEHQPPPLSPEDAYRASQRPKPPPDASRGFGAAIKRILGVSADTTTSDQSAGPPITPKALTDEEKAARRRRTFFS